MPEILHLDVVSVLRKAASAGLLDERRAIQALADLEDLACERASRRPFLAPIWELRANVTPCAAAYVALAETVEATLVTADSRLTGAPGLGCAAEHLD
ncbi:MAG: type II toxin-antitoxin system VapC family toxin [Acidimicrobiales bacterium]